MNKAHLGKKLASLSLSMFRKDFFGIYHGSISAKTDSGRFLINTKEAVFDALDEHALIELYFKKDYRWNQASIDANIHYNIYSQITEAKFISFTMPPFTTAYSLNHNIIDPKDYFGHNDLGSIEIYDPKNFDDWYDRASSEITTYFQTHKTNIIVIRGYGVYAFSRDVHEMARKLAILEKSCRILMLSESASRYDLD
ncbi:MAG: class II aldolase/adducin family protein [Epsilonproteobacteria bacterium]|nr:class II aldolase/adducin family protein [Campylobacterota bacterium]